MRANPSSIGRERAPPLGRPVNVAPRIPVRKDDGPTGPTSFVDGRLLYCSPHPLPGGVIGSTPVSGSGSWGSSPCPAVSVRPRSSQSVAATRAAATVPAGAAHPLHHPPACDRSRVPAAQAPGAGADVLAAVRRRRTCSTPRRREERCTAALVLDVDPVGLVAPRARARSRWPSTSTTGPYVASSLLSVALVTVFKTAMEGAQARAGGDRRSRWRRRCRPCPRAAARSSCGGCSSRSATRSTSRPAARPGVPEWGASRYVALTLRRRSRLSRAADAPLRAAAGARRREALLGRRRRGREAAAPRRGLAAGAPGAGADHAPLPQARAAARSTRCWPRSTRPRRSRTASARRRSRSASRCATSGSGTVQAVLQASGAQARARPRLRRRERCSSGSCATTTSWSPASTSRARALDAAPSGA